MALRFNPSIRLFAVLVAFSTTPTSRTLESVPPAVVILMRTRVTIILEASGFFHTKAKALAFPALRVPFATFKPAASEAARVSSSVSINESSEVIFEEREPPFRTKVAAPGAVYVIYCFS